MNTDNTNFPLTPQDQAAIFDIAYMILTALRKDRYTPFATDQNLQNLAELLLQMRIDLSIRHGISCEKPAYDVYEEA
jgi:hypothetical protein